MINFIKIPTFLHTKLWARVDAASLLRRHNVRTHKNEVTTSVLLLFACIVKFLPFAEAPTTTTATLRRNVESGLGVPCPD